MKRAQGGARVHLDTKDAEEALARLAELARGVGTVAGAKRKLNPAAVAQAQRRHNRRNGNV